MATPADAGANAPDTLAETSGLAAYVADKWQELLVLALIIAFLVYTVVYMRKRFPIVREFFTFLRERKLWWMTPIVVIFVLLATLIVVMEGSAIAPFIYALF